MHVKEMNPGLTYPVRSKNADAKIVRLCSCTTKYKVLCKITASYLKMGLKGNIMIVRVMFPAILLLLVSDL